MPVRRIHADDRIAEDSKVGPTALALDRINRVGLAGVEVSRDRRGKVATSRESPDADLFRVEALFFGASPDQANGTLGILEGDGMMIARPEAIFDDERGDT